MNLLYEESSSEWCKEGVTWSECVVLCRSALRIYLIGGYWLFTPSYIPLSSSWLKKGVLLKSVSHLQSSLHPMTDQYNDTNACLAPLPLRIWLGDWGLGICLKVIPRFLVLCKICWVPCCNIIKLELQPLPEQSYFPCSFIGSIPEVTLQLNPYLYISESQSLFFRESVLWHLGRRRDYFLLRKQLAQIHRREKWQVWTLSNLLLEFRCIGEHAWGERWKPDHKRLWMLGWLPWIPSLIGNLEHSWLLEQAAKLIWTLLWEYCKVCKLHLHAIEEGFILKTHWRDYLRFPGGEIIVFGHG